MTQSSKQPRISLAAPDREAQARLAAMPEGERRAFIEAEIMKGFEGTPRKLTPEEIKARVLKKLAAHV